MRKLTWTVGLHFDAKANERESVRSKSEKLLGVTSQPSAGGLLVWHAFDEAEAFAMVKKLSPFAHKLEGNYILNCGLQGEHRPRVAEGRRKKVKRSA